GINALTLGSTHSTSTMLIQGGTSINLVGAVGTTILLGNTAQTGTITIGSSTAANSVLIQNGINTGAQITSIANGACAANSTVNVLSGIVSTGTQIFNLFTAAGAATAQTLNIFSGANTNTTNTINVGSSTGTLITTNLLTGAVAHVL